MKRPDCLRILAEHHDDELVICNLGQTSSQWWEVNPRRDDGTFYASSSMGLVSSMALGLAMALPHRTVWALDGDGSLAMNLGTLLTTACVAPANLLHIVWFNRAYEATGRQPLGMAASADLAAMARDAGVPEVRSVSDLDGFRAAVGELARPKRHSFVLAEVEAQAKGANLSPRFPTDMAYRFGRYIEQTENIAVFGV